jgi:hypothetical protein
MQVHIHTYLVHTVGYVQLCERAQACFKKQETGHICNGSPPLRNCSITFHRTPVRSRYKLYLRVIVKFFPHILNGLQQVRTIHYLYKQCNEDTEIVFKNHFSRRCS